MAKMKKAVGKYAVSFNTRIGEYEVGESSENSIDYTGDDIDALAVETIAGDTAFPLIFERVTNHRSVVGVFRDATFPEDIVAVMVIYTAM